MSTETAVRQPVQRFKTKGGIEAAVWENQAERKNRGGTYTYYSVTLRKSYFDEGAQEYRETSSLFADELPRAQLVLAKAYDYIMSRTGAGDPNAGDDAA